MISSRGTAAGTRALCLALLLATLIAAGCAPLAQVVFREQAPETFSEVGFCWPVNGVVTSSFGVRTLRGDTRNHEGIDIAGHKRFAPVFAPKDGIVSVRARGRAYGKWLEIRHADGYVTRYAHLSWQLVPVRFRVKRGFVIGRIGSTGRSTGPHLHFEVFRKGKRIDPLTVLPPLEAPRNLIGSLADRPPAAGPLEPPTPDPAPAAPRR